MTCVVARILPPFRTVRALILQEWLPKSLEDVAKSIDLNTQLAAHVKMSPPEQPIMSHIVEEALHKANAEADTSAQLDALATSNPIDQEAHDQTLINSGNEHTPAVQQEKKGATSLEEQCALRL